MELKELQPRDTFQHRVTYFTKSPLTSIEWIESTKGNISYKTNPAFIYISACLKNDLYRAVYLGWLCELFLTFYQSFPMITRNILFSVAHFIKWNPKACGDDEREMFREMAEMGLNVNTDRVMKMAAIQVIRALGPSVEGIRILSKAFKNEGEQFFKTMIKTTVGNMCQMLKYKKN